MDPINTLGNNFALSNEDIVEGMKRSAAALAAVGTDYKDAFAIFTGAQEVMQNAEKTGTALRSVAMRIRGFDENSEDGMEEASEELENITGDLIDLTKTAEHSQGVSVFKEGSTTEFKSLVDYFGEINEIWDEMTQKQQNDFLTKAFGKTQAQAGAALITNYQSVADSIETMEDSLGSADREMSIIEESIEYKTNALKETWTGVVQSLIDRGDIGAIVDALTKISEAIGWVVDKAGLLGTIGLGAGLFAGINNNSIFRTFESDIDKISAKWGMFGRSFNQIGTAINDKITSIKNNFYVSNNLSASIKNSGDSILKRLYPSKASIESQMVSVMPKIETGNIEYATGVIKNLSAQVANGKTTWQKLFDTLPEGKKHFAQLGQQMEGQIITTEGVAKANKKARDLTIAYNTALKQQTLGAKAASVATKALSIAGNIAFMALINSVITAVTTYIKASTEIAAKAQELGESLSTTSTELEKYQEKVEELQSTIYDSSSSISDVTNARKELMSIQDEIIDKYGTEQKSINAIVKALKNEKDGWEDLKETQWQESLIDYNDNNGDGSAGDVFKGMFKTLRNAFDGYKTNVDRMIGEYVNLRGTGVGVGALDLSYVKDEETKNAIIDLLKEVDFLSYQEGYGFLLKDVNNATDAYQKLLKIQNLIQEANFEGTDDLNQNLSTSIAEYKRVSENYKEFYDQYILNEKILKKNSEYADAFKDITDAYNNYQDAIETNDEEKVQKAKDNLFKDISDEMAKALKNDDEDVADYFRSMYPELQEEISTWEFKIKFEADTDNLKTDVSNIFGEDGVFKGKSKEEIIDFDYKTASDKEKQAYGKLEGLVEKYHLSSIDELLNILESYGLVQSMDYQELIDKWGKDNVEKIDKEDLQYAYTIEPTDDMTFEQFQKEIAKAKKEASKLEETTRSGMISKLNNLSEGFEELDKIYASILDKDTFDFKLLDDKKFKETFSSLDNYADFVETVTSNPNDINACKDAFSKLVTEWITSTKVLDNVTEDNEKLTAAMLKQMGVANADKVVHYALEKAKAKEHIETNDGIDVTNANTDALIAEATAAGINTNAFLEMVAKEIMFNNTELDTEAKCQKILEIAKACGVASTSIEALKSQINDWGSEDNLGKGIRTQTAKDAGLKVEGKKERGAKEYEKHGNLYIASDGKEFENYKEAMYYQEALNSIDNINSAFEYNTLKYTGGSTSQDKEKSIENSKEHFDWIERAVKKVQRTITNLGKTVSATYKTWTTRNSALTQEIAEVNNELSLQQQAYERYMAQAESIGLSSYYKNRIQNGSLSIDSISDDDLKKQIKDYQDFYEKALSAADAVQDLQDQLAELGKSKFQNKITEYEKQLKEIEDYKSTLESVKSLLETQGYVVSHNLYTTLAELEKDNIENLKEEYEALTNSLNYAMENGVEKYSDDWYDMCSQIQDVNEQIISANTNLAELINQLRELDWELFDTKQDRISQITSESDWLIDLMSNKDLFDEDSGTITEQGKATLGLHAINYNTYMSQADDYAEELLKINEQIANDPNNTNLLERREELLESQRDMIDAAEDEKQAMKDLISEGYDSYLNALQEVIDKRKEAMDQIKDLYDYEKNISELNKNITILEKQEIAFRGNDSEEGMAKWQEIQASLEEARQNLEETEYERYIDDQQKMLDTLYEDAEQWVNERLDNQELLIQNVIDEANNNAESIKETLEKEVRDVGSVLSDNMMNILSPDSNVGQIVSMYGDNFNTYANTTVNTLLGIKAGVDAMLADSGIKVNTNIEALKLSNPYTSSSSGSSSTTDNSSASSSTNSSSSSNSGWGSWFIPKKNSVAKSRLHIDTSIVDRLKFYDYDSSENARAKYYKSMGGSGEYYGTAKQNRWMIQQMRNNGFKQGGLIGEAIRNSGEDGFILARTGEEVLSLEKIAKLKETLNLVNPLADTMAKMQIKLPDVQPRDNNITQNNEFHFTLNDVTNGEQLLDFVKNDKRFIKTIQQETIGAMMGQNSLGRYKY